MKNNLKTVLIVLTACLIILLSGCSPAEVNQQISQETTRIEQTTEAVSKQTTEAPSGQTTEAAVTPEAPVKLFVSAAASLKDVMEELHGIYTEAHPNVSILYNFASSGSLQQQIENGADVDVFVSAAVKQMDALSEKGLIVEETRKDFLLNRIALVVSAEVSDISDFNDLKSDRIKVIGLGEPKSVPVGQYAEEALGTLGILADIQSKVVYGKDVKEVLTWVETGNADAGIVYITDALISDKVEIAAIAPDGIHQPVYYPAAVIKDSKNAEAATAFTDFLYSEKAKPVFEKYGFAVVLE